MTYEKLLELLGVTELPGNPDESQLNDILAVAETVAARKGENWIRENRKTLLEEMEFLITFI